jgi:hypothetical protein
MVKVREAGEIPSVGEDETPWTLKAGRVCPP